MSRIFFPPVLILLFALLILTACGSANSDDTAVTIPQPDGLPTLLPTAVLAMPEETDNGDMPAEDSPDSPREASNDTGLPPTFTPVPAVERATPVPGNTGVTIPPAGGDNNNSDTPPTTGQTYTVQPGDTLAVIAAEFGVPLDQLITLNDITDPDRIGVGDILLIPTD